MVESSVLRPFQRIPVPPQRGRHLQRRGLGNADSRDESAQMRQLGHPAVSSCGAEGSLILWLVYRLRHKPLDTQATCRFSDQASWAPMGIRSPGLSARKLGIVGVRGR